MATTNKPNTTQPNPTGNRPGQTEGNTPQQPMEFPNQPLQPSRNNPTATPPGMRPEGERKDPAKQTDDSGCCTPGGSRNDETRRTPPGGPERQDIEAD